MRREWHPWFHCHTHFFSKFALACNRHTLLFINDQPPQPWGFQEFFRDDSHFKKKKFPTHFNTKTFSLSTIKVEFWGKKTWGPWSIWMKNDLKEQKLNWFKLEKIFYGWVNFIQTFRTAQNVIEKQSQQVWMLYHSFETATTTFFLQYQ